MTKQPYIYTLPEQFVKDPSVPARWRVWAVINGFFIRGKTCWASNEWIGEQIGSHKDTVSQAVKELEGMGLMVCRRTARTRLISPADPMIGTNAYLRSVPTPISDRHQRLSTSVSISVIKEGAERESSQEDKISSRVIPMPYSVESTRGLWSKGELRLQVLNWYFTEAGLWSKATSKARLQALMRRHNNAAVRIAQAEWSPSELKAAKKQIDHNDSLQGEWTLETLEKYLTK